MKKNNLVFKFWLFLSMSMLCLSANGQELIQLIDFETDNFMIASEFVEECDLPDSPQNDGTFGLANGRIELNDSEGTCCPQSKSQGRNNNFIFILGEPILGNYCNVTVSVEASASGTDFHCNPNTCASFSGADFFIIHVDMGDGFQPLGSFCGDNRNGSFSFTFENIEIGTVPLFQISGGVQNENSTYILDDFRIEGTPKSLVDTEILSADGNRLCEGSEVLILTAIPNNADSYEWVGPNGPIPSTDPNVSIGLVSPMDAGVYSVTVTEAGGCTSTAELAIEVIDLSQKEEDDRFPFILDRYCANSGNLDLPIRPVTDDEKTGMWNVENPLSLEGLSDSALLVYIYDDLVTPNDSLYLRIDTLLSVGNKIDTMDICAKTNTPFVNLVEIFDLDLDNISSVLAFGSGRNKGELQNLNVSEILPGPDVITIRSFGNGACPENEIKIPIMFHIVEVGENNFLSFCTEETQTMFPDFLDALNLSKNAVGKWRDVQNSGIDLDILTAVDISSLTEGTYRYEFIVDESTICGNSVVDTSVLTLVIQPTLALDIPDQTVIMTCDNTTRKIQFDFTFELTNYTISLEVLDQNNNTVGIFDYEAIEEAHFINIVQDDGVVRVDGNTLFVNQNQGDSYTLIAQSFTSSIDAMCPIGTPTGQASIEFNSEIRIPLDTTICSGDIFTFDEVDYNSNFMDEIVITGENGCDTIFELSVIVDDLVMMDIDTMICNGEVFEFNGEVFSEPLAGFPIQVAASTGCDTMFMVSLQFDPLITRSIDTTLCEGDIFTFEGVDYLFPEENAPIIKKAIGGGCDTTFFLTLNFDPQLISELNESICEGEVFSFQGEDYTSAQVDLPIIVSSGGMGCDTTFILNLEVMQDVMLQAQIDPCNEISEFRGISISADTTIIIPAQSMGCDTIFQVLYVPTTLPDSMFFTKRCETDSLVLGNMIFNNDNPTGSYMITTPLGCVQQVNVEVTFEAGFELNLDTILCTGESLSIGNVFFNIDNTNGTIILPANDDFNCDTTVFVNVGFREPVVYVHPVELCSGASSNQFGININENTSINESFLIGANGCDTLVSFDISLTSISVTASTYESCVDDMTGSIDLLINNGVGPYTLDVNGEISNSENDMITIANLAPGNYLVDIVDAKGCIITRIFAVGESVLDLDFLSTQNAQDGIDLEVISQQTLTTINWEPSIGLSCDDCTSTTANPDENTIYTVTAFDENGCSETISIEVIVNKNSTQEELFYLPNAISPLKDVNSTLYLQAPNGSVNSYDMSVYNRYGERVFEMNNAAPNVPAFGWDGRRSGKILQPDVYVYHIVMRNSDGSTRVETGDVLIVH